jgi:hypothetical protein
VLVHNEPVELPHSVAHRLQPLKQRLLSNDEDEEEEAAAEETGKEEEGGLEGSRKYEDDDGDSGAADTRRGERLSACTAAS